MNPSLLTWRGCARANSGLKRRLGLINTSPADMEEVCLRICGRGQCSPAGWQVESGVTWFKTLHLLTAKGTYLCNMGYQSKDTRFLLHERFALPAPQEAAGGTGAPGLPSCRAARAFG